MGEELGKYDEDGNYIPGIDPDLDNDNVVNFKDVINYKENHNITNIELNKLSSNVLKLYKSGVPIDVIEYQLKNKINKCKILKKKI